MLTIRMQRTGRKGHAMFRVVVQDSRRTPTSGKIVALLGNYDPHTKTATLKVDRAKFYLEHGAQPSDRSAKLLKSEGVKLPKWVGLEAKKTGAIKNLEKLRRNRPEGSKAPVKEAEAPTEEVAEEVTENPEVTTDALPETPETEVSDKPETASEVEEPKAEEVEAEPEAEAEKTEEVEETQAEESAEKETKTEKTSDEASDDK